MLKRMLRRFFVPEVRKSTRFPVSKDIQCMVSVPKYQETVPVYLGDVSSTGLSFFYKRPWFEAEDSVDVLLTKDERSTSLPGKIVSQRIFYPQGSEDIKLAIYRYSIKFAIPLGPEPLEMLKSISVLTSEVHAD